MRHWKNEGAEAGEAGVYLKSTAGIGSDEQLGSSCFEHVARFALP